MSQTSAATSDVYFWDASAENSWPVRTSFPKVFMVIPPEPKREKKPSKWLQKQIKRRGCTKQ